MIESTVSKDAAVVSISGRGLPDSEEEDEALGFEVSLEPGKLLTLKQLERVYIEKILAVAGGNKAKAVKLLGIGRTTLYRKLGMRRD